jgi:glutamine---fructose-6-phosphate transaminase (isomerizing)
VSQFENFLAQAVSLSTMIGPSVDRLEPAARTVLSTPEIFGIRQIILAGSGDSYFAAAGAVSMFRDLTGLPVQAMTSMEASRYAGGLGKSVINARGTLVVAISYSGEAARLVEAATRWRHRGALTLGVTAASGSRLANVAERTLDTQVEEAAPAPGTRTYIAGLIALHLLAIRLGEVLMRITMDKANAYRQELSGIGAALGETHAAMLGPLREFAETSREWRTFDVLGSGPGLGAAGYCAAKLVEASGVHALPQDIEEFFHLNFFVDKPAETPTILFAPSEASAASRSTELITTLRQLGRPTAVITDRADFGHGHLEILHPRVAEWFVPIVQTVPAAILAAHAADLRTAVHYRGHDGAWIGAKGAALVRDSAIEVGNG